MSVAINVASCPVIVTACVKGDPVAPACVAITLIWYVLFARSEHVGAVLQTVSAPVDASILNLPLSVPLIAHVPENDGEAGNIVAAAVNTS